MLYPPPPWHLVGNVHLTWWWTGRGFTATIFAEYLPGGVLAYHEFAIARLVWNRGLALTVPAIWVDSEAARDVGRDLWDIPKELADFRFEATELSAEGIATAQIRSGLPLGRWPFSIRVVQPRCTSRLSIRGRVRFAKLRWQFTGEVSTQPVELITPILSLTVIDATITFG